MKPQPNKSPLLQLANTLGKPLAWVLRKQLGLVNWLVTKGWSKGVAKLIIKAINILIFTILFFVIFPGWQALVALFVIFVVIAGIKIELPTSAEEWRDGIDGWGLYDNHFDMRIDGGSSNNENDPSR